MARTLHEYKCSCGNRAWSGIKPKPGSSIKKVPVCSKCKRPMLQVTGVTKKVYSVRELL